MGSFEEVCTYMKWLIRRFENQKKEAERFYDEAQKNLDDFMWIITELALSDSEKEQEEAIIEKRPCSVYYIANAEMSLVKIGISVNVDNRIKSMQTSTGYYLELINEIVFDSVEEARKVESWLHREFGMWRRKPHKIAKNSEWFDYCITDRLMSQYDTKEKIIKAMNDEEMAMQKAMNDVWICTEEEKGEKA